MPRTKVGTRLRVTLFRPMNLESPMGRNSQPAVAIWNRLQNRCPLLQDTLVFDPVQAPSLRYAFELVNAAILEADSRLRHQILDRARDQDFAGTRFRGDARADVKRETEHLRPAHFVFARV